MGKLYDFDGNILYTCGLDVLYVEKLTLSNKRILFQQNMTHLDLSYIYFILKNCNNLSSGENQTQGI